MDLLAEIAKLFGEHPLHGHVDILIVFTDDKIAFCRKLGNAAKFLAHFCGLRLRDNWTRQAHFAKHGNMRGRAHAIPLGQIKIENRIFAHGVRKNIGIDCPGYGFFGFHVIAPFQFFSRLQKRHSNSHLLHQAAL